MEDDDDAKVIKRLFETIVKNRTTVGKKQKEIIFNYFSVNKLFIFQHRCMQKLYRKRTTDRGRQFVTNSTKRNVEESSERKINKKKC